MNRIREVRQKNHLNQTDFSRLFNISQAALSGWETGKYQPDIDVLKRISNYFDVSLDYLLNSETGSVDKQNALPRSIRQVSEIGFHRVPLVGGVAAGEGVLCDTDYDSFVDAPEKADYALRVEGDSMEPIYQDGDIVYIRQQDDVDDGQVGVVLMDDSAAMKHIYHLKHGLQLISNNAKYPPRNITIGDYDTIRILGLVVGFTRMYTDAEQFR